MKVNIYFLICNWKVIVSWLNGLDLHLRWSRNKTIWTIFHVEGTVQQGLPRSSRLDGKTFEYWLQNQNSAEKVQSTHLKGLFAWGRGGGAKTYLAEFCLNSTYRWMGLPWFFSVSSWTILWSLRTGLVRSDICHSRHCRRQCKIFASGVNFSRNNAIYNINESKKCILSWFLSLKLLRYY